MYYKYIKDFSIKPDCYGDLFVSGEFIASQNEIDKILHKGAKNG